MKRITFAFLALVAAACGSPSSVAPSSGDASAPAMVRRGGPLTPPGGTITAVHAGTNMSGGGTAGSVTVNLIHSPNVEQIVAAALNLGFGCAPAALPATPTVTDSWDPWTTTGGSCFTTIDGHRVSHIRVVTAQFGSILGSLKGGAVGDIVILENHGDGNEAIGNGLLKVLNRDTSDHSVPVADHIFMPNLTDTIFPYGGNIVLYYDATNVGWIPYSTSLGDAHYSGIVTSGLSLAYPLTPTFLAAGRTDDYDITAGGPFDCGMTCSSWVRLNGDSGGSQLSGIIPHNVNAGPSSLLAQGQVLYLENIGGDITLCDEVTDSSCANHSTSGHRIVSTYGDVKVKRSQIVMLVYDQQGGGFLSQARWHVVGSVAGSIDGTAGDLAVFNTGGGSVGPFAGSTSNTCGAGSAASSVAFSAAGATSVTCVAAGSTGGTSGYYALWNSSSSQTIGSATDDGTMFGVNGQLTVDEGTGNTKVQGTLGVYGALTVQPFSTVTKDATSAWYTPASSGEWTTLLTGSGVSNPSHLWLMQESSGTLADTIGSTTLTNTGTLSYQQSVTGWSRKAMSAPNANGHYYLFNNTDTALPNSATTSFATLIIMTIDGSSGTRDVFGSGNCNGVWASVTSTPKITTSINGTNHATGAATIDMGVHAWLIRSNATASTYKITTDFDSTVTTTWATPDSTKEIFFGGACNTAPGMHILYSTMWVGAAAEFTDAQAKDIIDRVELGSTASTFGVPINMSSNQIHNVLDPTSAQDAATKNYVDTTFVKPSPTWTFFGSGNDGTVTADGSTTLACLGAPSSSIYTMTRDCMFSGLTVNSGVTIKMANYALFVAGTLSNSGVIQNDGTTAVTTTGGAPSSAGRFAATISGGGSVNNSVGASTQAPLGYIQAISAAAGVNGGAGTSGTSGRCNGGAGGGNTAGPSAGTNGGAISIGLANIAADFNSLLASKSLTGSSTYTYGTGGAQGAGGPQAGSGGAGGGMVWIAAEKITGTSGAIHSRGGDASSGNNFGSNGGGGGGGGGGLVVLVYFTMSGQTVDANGGAHGTQGASPGNGLNGGDGGSCVIAKFNLSGDGT